MSDNEVVSAYRFVIEIDNIQSAQFKKCSGLEISADVIEIEEGGYNYSTRKFIGETHYQNIILEKGITNNNELFNWNFYSELADNERERKSGSIVLLNTQGKEIKRWNFFRAFPCLWAGPNLVAGLHGEYAIEKIEIAIEKLEPDIKPTYFTQGQWASEFTQKFANNACTATSLLNEVSEEYTKQTGKAMTQEQGLAAMQSAVNNNGVNQDNANVDNWQKAETGMWDSTGLPGTLTHNEQSTEHVIYALDTNNTPDTAEHFVNSSAEGQYFDPWNGETGNVNSVDLQCGRPQRGFDYTPPTEGR
jgi:phage tail-like protein